MVSQMRKLLDESVKDDHLEIALIVKRLTKSEAFEFFEALQKVPYIEVTGFPTEFEELKEIMRLTHEGPEIKAPRNYLHLFNDNNKGDLR